MKKRCKVYHKERFNILVTNGNKHLVETLLKINNSKLEASAYLKKYTKYDN